MGSICLGAIPAAHKDFRSLVPLERWVLGHILFEGISEAFRASSPGDLRDDCFAHDRFSGGVFFFILGLRFISRLTHALFLGLFLGFRFLAYGLFRLAILFRTEPQQCLIVISYIISRV
jgi:hypothetical protein